MTFRTTTSIAPLLALFSLLFACSSGDDNHDNHDDNHHDEESPAEEACIHIQEGPAAATTAEATATGASLPSVSTPHTRHDITFVTGDDFGDERGGYVRYEASESGDFTFYLGADVSMELSSGDTVLMAESMESTLAACEEVKSTYTFELQGGTSYTIKFGPTQEIALGLVVEHAGEEHDH